MSGRVLMPKGTAMWLINNTSLSIRQVAQFCQMDVLQIETSISDKSSGDVYEINPIVNGQLSADDIKHCEATPSADLRIIEFKSPIKTKATSKAKYIPIVYRRSIPGAIVWLLDNYPNITDIQIRKILPTTKKTIMGIRGDLKEKKMALQAIDPVMAGLCNITTLENVLVNLTNNLANISSIRAD